ncbi:kynurenine/alpha-aminoadipate aminotransferase, mitochondrial-like [Babylonia areolata]|uniref:kynurenine/alpha-aminoadipate aminotransferase, mitochondrial-like n=1 Tax=Babylonia areolata TaxID=304850 RepID=UPI003FD06105
MNYNRFFNPTSLARQPSPIRVLTSLVASGLPPSFVSMAGGMPNADLFPIQEASLTLRDGSKLKIDSARMKKALQYSPTPGMPELLQWVRKLQKELHNPPTMGIDDPQRQLDVIITSGSQDGICKTFEACVEEGQNVLLEYPTYPGVLSAVRPMRPKICGVKSDRDGLIPSHLLEVLSQWKPSDAKDENSTIPKLLYLIPNGGNPSGAGLTLSRKKEIYDIARTYDLLILEDDPYYFLQFSQPYVPSFLSMDEDGRVVRFDSFSKVLSGGARVGVMTGPKAVVERVSLHMQVSVMHSSGLAQACLLAVLESMGLEGFRRHALAVADFYQKQRDACIAAAEKHLTGLAEWSVPSGGMFLWIRLLNIPDSYSLIMEKAMAAEVLFVPGQVFQADESVPSPYIRASYSLVSPENMEKGFERLAKLLKEETREQ